MPPAHLRKSASRQQHYHRQNLEIISREKAESRHYAGERNHQPHHPPPPLGVPPLPSPRQHSPRHRRRNHNPSMKPRPIQRAQQHVPGQRIDERRARVDPPPAPDLVPISR